MELKSAHNWRDKATNMNHSYWQPVKSPFISMSVRTQSHRNGVTSQDRRSTKLFMKVSLPDLFPNLPNASTIQDIWTKYTELNAIIRLEAISVEESTTFAAKSKAWLQLYLTVYQTKHVTPYIHALVAHLHEFFKFMEPLFPLPSRV